MEEDDDDDDDDCLFNRFNKEISIRASHDPAPLATLELHHLHSPSPVELTVLQPSPRPAPALVPPPISVSGPAPQQALPAVSDPSSAAPPAPLTLPDPDSAAAAPPDLEPSSVDPLALSAELPSSTAPLPSSPPLHGHHMITRLRDGVKQPKIRTDGTELKVVMMMMMNLENHVMLMVNLSLERNEVKIEYFHLQVLNFDDFLPPK
ncbi:hypothetical protein LWI28_019918 [Acer negundo]|uniref:Uncharacterized protein n=1 Tax=Acer negundo TaxID=4023 RepID=A0AAD5I6S1_ACENE|nr:hypothetical protein LWI28_019918 [Acer negundo]